MLDFQLVSLSGLQFDDAAYEVIVPTQAGDISLFADHMPLISSAAPGLIRIRRKAGDSDNSLEIFTTMGGLVEIDGKRVRFLADDVAVADEISESEAAEAVKRAEALISSAKDQVSLNEARQSLQRNTVRLQAARLKKRHH